MRDTTKIKKTVPSYRLLKASGRAVVTLPASQGVRRRDVFLGRYGTEESHQRYAQVIAEVECHWASAPGANKRHHNRGACRPLLGTRSPLLRQRWEANIRAGDNQASLGPPAQTSRLESRS